jgi:carboxylate-amine ligase
VRSIGVEEELLLVDAGSGEPASAAPQLTPAPELQAELQREQIEIGSSPVKSLAELRTELRDLRRSAAQRAASVGAAIAALATAPGPVTARTTDKARYHRMVERFAVIAEDQLTCGCHVHVEVADDEEGVAVLDRIRVWLPVLLALSANSPFWQGEDTRYASFRNQSWNRWPGAGPTDIFGSAESYHATVAALTSSGTLLDAGMVYFDARLSSTFPTVEIRIADVCLRVDDAVLLAALSRGLVDTAARQWRADHGPPVVRTELLQAATWRASRSGLAADLLHPLTLRPVPAPVAIDGLVQHIGPALEDLGDLTEVHELIAALLARGDGAAAQRAAYSRRGRIEDVVADAVSATIAS